MARKLEARSKKLLFQRLHVILIFALTRGAGAHTLPPQKFAIITLPIIFTLPQTALKKDSWQNILPAPFGEDSVGIFYKFVYMSFFILYGVP